MRVLFWCEQFWPKIGGIEVWGTKLLRALRERGHDLAVVASQETPASPREERHGGIAVYRFPFWEALTNRNMDQLLDIKRAVARVKRTFEPALIHLNLTGPSIYFHLQTAEALAAPLLVSLHQPLENQSGSRGSVVNRILSSADWVTAGSEVVLTTARRLAPEIISRSSLIYFGFDAPEFSPEPLRFDEPRLLCLGRLVHEKGFDLVLTAFASLTERFRSLRLIIASDGPARPHLERQARELGLADAVDFIGWVESNKLPALFNSATIVVMPSRVTEGFGFVAMEAAMMGRPVVATRSGGLTEAVVEGETGLLVEREDSAALADAIASILDRPEVAKKMSQAAQTRARATFNSKQHVDAFDALYRQLVDDFSRAKSRPPDLREKV
jgi:glycosyltransferase involved in cell wall biosynthesis